MMKSSIPLALALLPLLASDLHSASLHAGASASGEKQANDRMVDLFFVGGQSNATTNFYAGIRSELIASAKFPDLQVVWKQHSGNPIHNWFNQHPRTNYLVDLFDPSAGMGALEAAASNIVATGGSYRIRGYFWFQGEGDTHNTNEVNAYAAKFTGMLDQLAVDLNDGRPVPFAIMLIGYNTNKPPQPPHIKLDQTGPVAALREVQRRLAENSAAGSHADSWGFPRVDTWHLTPTGAFDAGSALAGAFLSRQCPVTNSTPTSSTRSE